MIENIIPAPVCRQAGSSIRAFVAFVHLWHSYIRAFVAFLHSYIRGILKSEK